MQKEELINEIIDVCLEFEIIPVPKSMRELEDNFKDIIEDGWYMNILHETISEKANEYGTIHTRRIRNLLEMIEIIILDIQLKNESEEETNNKHKVMM